MGQYAIAHLSHRLAEPIQILHKICLTSIWTSQAQHWLSEPCMGILSCWTTACLEILVGEGR